MEPESEHAHQGKQHLLFFTLMSKWSESSTFYESCLPLVSIHVWEDEDQNSGLVNLYIHYSANTKIHDNTDFCSAVHVSFWK